MSYELGLITNTSEQTFYKEIKEAFKNCISFYFSVAFINYSGLQLLIDELSILNSKGIKGKILTTNYLYFTDSKSLNRLLEFENIDTKIFIVDEKHGFHTKGYIFEYEDHYKIFIGSSNITQSALKTNIEWNVKIISKKEDDFVNYVLDEFDSLMQQSQIVDDDFVQRYEELLRIIESQKETEKRVFRDDFVPKPNAMQIKALEGLKKVRSLGEKRALAISATATGKTFMAAFDVKNENPDTMLFIVHNENILKEAKETFEAVIKNKIMGFYTGSTKDTYAEYLFATIATISKSEHLNKFDRNHFKYIIIDEAHRSASKSYKDVIDYFEPEFLLGMTATPERTDGENIFKIYNYNIAVEIRLREALENDLIVPFHYFGIEDVTADLTNVDISKIDVVAKKLMIHARVDLVIEKMLHYGYQGNKRKCIGFCANRNHAKYMSDEFNSYGYKSIYLSGENSIQERQKAIDNLENDDNPLEFIFTVDIFNEGVDIKTVNLILMLRPTESAIIFTQQLGRGLRKAYNKEFLTVLDFIGNHNKTFLIPIALSGSRFYDPDSLKVALNDDFSDLPGCSNISLAKKTKMQILKQLDKVNFSSIKYLTEEYLEFKKMCGGKIPRLVNYIVENAPDPTKFIRERKNYWSFICYAEEKEYKLDSIQENFLNWISGLLPLQRIYEFVILKDLIINKKTDLAHARKRLSKYIDDIDDATIIHSFNYFNCMYFDVNETSKFSGYFKYNSRVLYLTEKANKCLEEKNFSVLLIDVIEYGLLRYENDYARTNYGKPFLKLYQSYAMKDLGLLSNYNKKFSSIRGNGVWRSGERSHCFFVTLYKGDKVKESLNYKDKFIDQNHFQWQSPNTTSSTSEIGKDYCQNKERKIDLHLFVRKYETLFGKAVPFIYVGKIIATDYYGGKPITIQYKLETELPLNIYRDLTVLVGDDESEKDN